MFDLRSVCSMLLALMLATGMSWQVFAEEEVADEAEASAPAVETQSVLTRPQTLDSLIDARRDALRDRREARSDAMRTLYGFVNPFMEMERQEWRRYADQMRSLHRARRDATKYHSDVYRATFMPWVKVQSDLADARRYAFVMESLDRQEMLEDLRFAYQPVIGAPFPW